jgi:hypothetical protein
VRELVLEKAATSSSDRSMNVCKGLRRLSEEKMHQYLVDTRSPGRGAPRVDLIQYPRIGCARPLKADIPHRCTMTLREI